ncbi:ankyrin repeat-containing domain protein [Obelidium mucronatum]|nr:ankyrin repeat-containing domain protein [Obelidium mucronatum]
MAEITNLAPELIEAILVNLPVDAGLNAVGLSSTAFGVLVFNSLSFANRHSHRHFLNWNNKNTVHYLNTLSPWNQLPLTYQAVIYKIHMQHQPGLEESLYNTERQIYNNWKHCSAPNMDSKIVHLLLENPKYFNPCCEDNRPLRMASSLGHTDVVKMLLRQSPTLVLDDTCSGNNVGFETAATAESKHLSMAKTFTSTDLHHHPSVDPSAQDNQAIKKAAEMGYPQIIQLLLTDTRVGAYNDALELACENGHTEIVQLLLSIDTVDPATDDNYPLILASLSGHADIVSLLLETGKTDPSARDDYAFIGACAFGCLDVARLLIALVDPAADYNRAIRDASANGLVDIVDLLLKDERVDASAEENWAIRYASSVCPRVVRLLLADAKVDPSACDNEAIREAAENGMAEIIPLLLGDDRVDPNVWNNFPLRVAVERDYNEAARALLADLRVDPSGQVLSRLDKLEWVGWQEIVRGSIPRLMVGFDY